MKKVLFLILLLNTLSARAQLVDTLGTLSVQGTLTSGSVGSVNRGFSMMKKNRLLQDIQQAVMEIKTQYSGNYWAVGPSSLSPGLLSGFQWSVGSQSGDLFYIELNQLDSQTCYSLLSARLSASFIELNGSRQEKTCRQDNQIKLFFN